MSAQRRSHGRCRRGGVVVVELLLALPILFIFLLAVVEFGVLLSASKRVEFASRFGAHLAAEQDSASDLNTFDLLGAVNQHLASSGIPAGACRVVLQHNVDSATTVTRDLGPGDCPACEPPTSDLPVAPASCSGTDLESVRVTVCVRATDVVPDLLCTFGFSIEDCVVTGTTTYRFEDCPLPP